jgi:hypothetical protein
MIIFYSGPLINTDPNDSIGGKETPSGLSSFHSLMDGSKAKISFDA